MPKRLVRRWQGPAKKLALTVGQFLLASCLLLSHGMTVDAGQPPTPRPGAASSATKSTQAAGGEVRTLEQQAASIDLIGHIGGTVNAVAVQGAYAYVGVGPRLIVMDVSDERAPRQVGQSMPMLDLVKAVAVSGEYAYVAAGSAGLHILKVANAAFPAEVGTVNIVGDAQGVNLAGSHAYVAAGTSLRVIDVSNPASPVEVGVYKNGGRLQGVVVVGTRAYVGSTYVLDPDPVYGLLVGDMRVLDVSNPTEPLEVGRYPSGVFDGLSVVGDYAYLASSYGSHFAATRSYLYVVSISDPSRPVLRGTYESPQLIRDVFVAAGKAYIASGDLRIIDVSVPTAPTLVGTTTASGVSRLAIAGSRVYAATEDSIQIVVVSDPANPARGGSYGWPQVRRFTVAGRYAYVLSDYTRLRVLDLSNPHMPLEVGSYLSPETVQGIAASDHYLYLANDGVTLRTVDVSNPSAPVAVGTYIGAPAGTYYGKPNGNSVALQGNYAYVVSEARTLRVIDVSNPAIPLEVGSFSLSSAGLVYATVAGSVAVAGNYAYLPTHQGLLVVDVSDPADPALASLIPGTALGVAVEGRNAYVVDPTAGLRIFDVSNPASPVQVGASRSSGYAALLVGGYAYLADYYGVLRVVSVLDPSKPTEVSSYNTAGREVRGLAADASYLYSGGPEGFLVLRFSGAGPGPSISNLSVNVIGADVAFPGEALSYVIILDNRGPTGVSVVLTDTIPANTSYIAGTLSGGAVYSDTVSSVLWSGVVPPGLSCLPSVVFGFRVRVGSGISSSAITNILIITDGSTTIMPRSMTKVFRRTFLPAVLNGAVGW